MNYLAGITLAATVLFNAGALAEDASTAGAGRQVVALADMSISNTHAGASALERYAGCYETDSGLRFFVFEDAGRLILELPASWGLGQPRLHANAPQQFTLEGLPMRVRFEATAAGVVKSLVVYDAATQRDIEAVKLPPRRGVVSIYDIDDATAATIAASN